MRTKLCSVAAANRSKEGILRGIYLDAFKLSDFSQTMAYLRAPQKPREKICNSFEIDITLLLCMNQKPHTNTRILRSDRCMKINAHHAMHTQYTFLIFVFCICASEKKRNEKHIDGEYYQVPCLTRTYVSHSQTNLLFCRQITREYLIYDQF